MMLLCSYFLYCKLLIVVSRYAAWEPFRDLIPENERTCFIEAYHKRLNSDDMETQVIYTL